VWNRKQYTNTGSTFNEVFQAHYPAFFNQLLTVLAALQIAVAPLNANAEAALI
jgi:hypothetical protein